MSQQHKIDEVYQPENKARQQRVVVGLSGGVASYVVAYLLKIQKYDLIGVTVATDWEGYQGDKTQTLSCYLDEPRLTQIKEFCHQLKIPHFTIKAQAEF